MGLAPATVVVWADQDHGDVELALLDVGDLEVGAALRTRSGAVRRAGEPPALADGAVEPDADASAMGRGRRRGWPCHHSNTRRR